MKSLNVLQLALAGLAALSVVGCSSELRGTPGQLGTLRFEYSAAGVCSGCAIDREVLAGSVLDVDVHGVHPRVDYLVRSTAPNIAEFQLTSRCRFIGEEGCRDGVAVIALQDGDADLEIYDGWTETVLDRVTIKVRAAASLDSSVRTTLGDAPAQDLKPTVEGTFELTKGSDVEIITTARSASGQALIATNAAIHSAYADETVLGPRPMWMGVSPTQFATAKSTGTASIAMVGGGVRRDLSFRVID
jgi:hypothetical protein